MASRDKPSVFQARKTVEDLRREFAVRRMKVSAASNELMRYVNDHQREDVLVTGFTNQKDNPFRPKSSFSCSLI